MRAVPLVTWLGAALTVSAAQQQMPVFRSGVETISIYATVTSDAGRLIPDLTADDFEVRDNGVVQNIKLFSQEVLPITVAILVDVSGSQESNVVWARDAARAFISELSDEDRARLGTFGAEVVLSLRLTNDKTYLGRILNEEVWPGGGTPLWRTMNLAMDSLRAERGRKVILLVTDGFDDRWRPRTNTSQMSTDRPLPMQSPDLTLPAQIDEESVKKRAVREEFMIYAVGRERAASDHRPLSEDMQWLAGESGGGYRLVSRSEDAAVVMKHVAEELHHQYLIGFTPAVLDGKVHKLEVRMKRRGMEVRARKSYVAAK